jgi:hypothetical protein
VVPHHHGVGEHGQHRKEKTIMQTINTDPARGITVVNASAYFSLGSPLWIQLTGGPFAKYTYSYAPRGQGWNDGEMATMNMARWGNNPKDEWYSASMRLDMALGFGAYEQSIKVGVGSGVTTTFYLSQKDADHWPVECCSQFQRMRHAAPLPE